MDFRQTFQNGSNKSEPTAAPVAPSTSEPHSKKPSKHEGKPALNLQNVFNAALLIGISLILFLLALFFLTKSNRSSEEQFVDTKKYQAVFLNNGQVYFGRIGGISTQYVDLRSVYYLTQATTNGANGSAGTNGDYTLVKLGCQQIHNPLDQMVISRSQVSFWENLSDDGKVVKSIKEFQKQNPNGPDCTQVSNQTQSATNPTATQQTTTPTATPTTPTTPSATPAQNR